MPTQTDLSGYAGDGPIQVQYQIFQNNSPFNTSGVITQIVLKSSAVQPDPVGPAPNVFTAGNFGLTSINNANGTGIWTIPSPFTAEPGNYWWHGTFNNGGSIVTWGFGNLTILEV